MLTGFSPALLLGCLAGRLCSAFVWSPVLPAGFRVGGLFSYFPISGSTVTAVPRCYASFLVATAGCLYAATLAFADGSAVMISAAAAVKRD